MYVCLFPSYEVILGLLPASHHKLLAHIKKTQERAKRKRQQKVADEEEEENFVPAPQNRPERLAVSVTKQRSK